MFHGPPRPPRAGPGGTIEPNPRFGKSGSHYVSILPNKTDSCQPNGYLGTLCKTYRHLELSKRGFGSSLLHNPWMSCVRGRAVGHAAHVDSWTGAWSGIRPAYLGRTRDGCYLDTLCPPTSSTIAWTAGSAPPPPTGSTAHTTTKRVGGRRGRRGGTAASLVLAPGSGGIDGDRAGEGKRRHRWRSRRGGKRRHRWRSPREIGRAASLALAPGRWVGGGLGMKQKKRKADAFPRSIRVSVGPSGVSESVEIDGRFRGRVRVGCRSSRSFPSRVCDDPSLLGVALTFSVSQPDVATRLASRLRLRPSCLATWTLTSSAELRPVDVTRPV